MPIPLRSTPGNAWPAIPPPAAHGLWTTWAELERTQWLPSAECLEGQLTQLRALLAHCVEQVPYYQAALRGLTEVRSLDDVRRLPLLTRRLIEQQAGRLTAQRLPEGMVPAAAARTAGTSGLPIDVLQTSVTEEFTAALQVREFAWSGFEAAGALAVLRGLKATGAAHLRALAGFEEPAWDDRLAPLLATGPAHFLDIHQPATRQIDWLLRVQPNYLVSYPSHLELLAGLCAEQGRRPGRLQAILALGERLTGDARRFIEASFGVPVKNSYRCAEAGLIASPCPEGDGMHVHGESMLVEVLNDQGGPCQPGESGRVVLTSLVNFLHPLIRYDLGDSATVAAEPCACGRGLPLLTDVAGKPEPMLRLADGRRTDAGALLRQLRGLGVSHQRQIVQRGRDDVVVRLVPKAGVTVQPGERVVETVQAFFEAPMRVEVQWLEQLELTGAGKLRAATVERRTLA